MGYIENAEALAKELDDKIKTAKAEHETIDKQMKEIVSHLKSAGYSAGIVIDTLVDMYGVHFDKRHGSYSMEHYDKRAIKLYELGAVNRHAFQQRNSHNARSVIISEYVKLEFPDDFPPTAEV